MAIDQPPKLDYSPSPPAPSRKSEFRIWAETMGCALAVALVACVVFILVFGLWAGALFRFQLGP